MASLSRARSLCSLRRILPTHGRIFDVTARRGISKSESKQDGSTGQPSSTPSNLPVVPKNWVSYGFDAKNYYKDRLLTHLFMFFSVSWAMVFTAWILYYYPDMNKHEWNYREAFLEIKRREAAGLPHVDPNYVPPSQVKLPSDEELGSYEIII